MTEILRPDLCVIGGGPGGLAAARAAANLGASVVLVEKRPLGNGEALRAAWQAQFLAAAAQRSVMARPGDSAASPETPVDFRRLRRDATAAAERFAREDSQPQLAGLGVRLIQAGGNFTSPSRFEAEATAIEARKFLLAIGSFTTAPAIAGLELVRPLTAERIADLTLVPRRLAVIGATAENLMLAQAFLRLGSAVVLLQKDGFLPAEDPEITRPLLFGLRKEGLEIVDKAEVRGVELAGSGPQGTSVKLMLGDGSSVEASHLLYAGERQPLVEGLGLKAARVAYDKDGIRLKASGRSSNRRIYGLSDSGESFQTLIAARRRGEFLAEQLFGAKGRPPEVARIVPTDPEIASIGLSEARARAEKKRIRIYRAGFSDNLRAGTLPQPVHYPSAGHIKLIADPSGTLLGAAVAGPQAREVIGLLSLALSQGMKLQDLEAIVASEPALIDICRAAALASAPQTGKGSLKASLGWSLSAFRPMR